MATKNISDRGPPRDEVKLKQIFSCVHDEAFLARPEERLMGELIAADASDKEVAAQVRRWRSHTGKMIELVDEAIGLVGEPGLTAVPALKRLARAIRAG